MKITEIVLGAFCFLIMSSMTLKAQSTPILKLLIVCEDNEPIGYYQKVTQQFTSSSLRPFILFSYTLRKHSKLQIRSLMPEGAL